MNVASAAIDELSGDCPSPGDRFTEELTFMITLLMSVIHHRIQNTRKHRALWKILVLGNGRSTIPLLSPVLATYHTVWHLCHLFCRVKTVLFTLYCQLEQKFGICDQRANITQKPIFTPASRTSQMVPTSSRVLVKLTVGKRYWCAGRRQGNV